MWGSRAGEAPGLDGGRPGAADSAARTASCRADPWEEVGGRPRGLEAGIGHDGDGGGRPSGWRRADQPAASKSLHALGQHRGTAAGGDRRGVGVPRPGLPRCGCWRRPMPLGCGRLASRGVDTAARGAAVAWPPWRRHSVVARGRSPPGRRPPPSPRHRWRSAVSKVRSSARPSWLPMATRRAEAWLGPAAEAGA